MSEREIVKRLIESKEYDEELEESSFESNGHTYKCAFGKYYMDDELISREDYMKAKDGGSSEPIEKSYEDYTPEEFQSEIDDIEVAIENAVDDASVARNTEEYAGALDHLDKMMDKLYAMEDYVSDEQYDYIDELKDKIRKGINTEYSGKDTDPYSEVGMRRSDF